MNMASQDFFNSLKEKLIGAGIPEDIAKKYSLYYEKGLMPELAFDNGEMPSDDCFKMLSVLYELFYKNRTEPITLLEIKGLLAVPYSRAEAAKKKMTELFPNNSAEISELYNKSLQLYYLRPDEVQYLYELISDYISDKEKLWQVFKVSAKVGVFYTESRFEAVETAVGSELASEVIYEASVNGYLLHPHYTDPITALENLTGMFDGQTVAKIILENPEYLYLYKDEYYVELPWQKEKRENDINCIIAKYKH